VAAAERAVTELLESRYRGYLQFLHVDVAALGRVASELLEDSSAASLWPLRREQLENLR
jgi:hypothetical protein